MTAALRRAVRAGYSGCRCGRSHRTRPCRPMPPASSASTTFAPSPRQAASAPARLVFLGVALLVIGIVFSDRSLDTPAFLWLQQVTEFVPPAFWAAWSVLGLGLCTALIAALVADKAM